MCVRRCWSELAESVKRDDTMPKIKTKVYQYLWTIVCIMVVILIAISVLASVFNEQRQAVENAEATFQRIEQIMDENQREIDLLMKDFRERSIHSANEIAYMVEHHPERLNDLNEIRTMAEFTDVDEIHFFDETGTLFSGTIPASFGMTFDSGEQMRFFKPMLEDKTLQLIQDAMPNTAHGEMFQYAAVWSGTGDYIVQVGMKAETMMKVTEKNEISHVLALLRVNPSVDYYAIDKETGVIKGSTNLESVGESAASVGLDLNTILSDSDGFHQNVNGTDSFCVFTEIDGNLVGRIITNQNLYSDVPADMIGLAVCTILVAIILVMMIGNYLNTYVVDEIHRINDKLEDITAGKLDEKVDVHSSLEFFELSGYINEMVHSLQDSTEKMSYVLNQTNLRVGVYEYNEQIKQVRFTEYVPKILGFTAEETQRLTADHILFKEYIGHLRRSALMGKEDVYCIGRGKEIYVKIEEVVRNNVILGIVQDVTSEVMRRRRIETERDVDLLTGLYNRRGLEHRLEELFSAPEEMGCGALIMIDADGLKEINDQYGHEAGDVYLQKVAQRITFSREKYVVGRHGGDEFVLFIYGFDSDKAVLDEIENLKYRQNHSTAFLGGRLIVPLKFSIGYSLLEEGRNYAGMLKEADKRMYENKRNRKMQ